MSSPDPALALEQAKAAFAAHRAVSLPPEACRHDWMNEQSRLADEIRKAERALSASRGEEHAELWDGAPCLRLAPLLPRVFHREHDRITVLAAVQYIAPEWKGKIVGDHLTYDNDSPVARIEFRDARHRWSTPGLSEITRHPLYGRGLDATAAMRIANSRWQGRGRHHLLMFESASLEILGHADPVEVWTLTMDEASSRCGGRLDPGPS